jgi:hypothetical protein
MRRFLPALAATALGLGCALAAEGWPEPPPDTRAMLLVTGADIGQYYPRGCLDNSGGSIYRKSFDAWLEQRYPDLPTAWVATGNVVADPEDDYLTPAEPMLRHLADVGYTVLGVGERELDHVGPARLSELGRRLGIDFVSSNLEVLETGKPALPGSRIVPLGDLRIGLVVISPHDPGKVWGDASTGTVLTVDPVPALRRRIAEVRGAGADRVVLLATSSSVHLRMWLSKLGDVDAVIASYGNVRASEPKMVEGVPVLWVAALGQTLGRVSLGPRGELLEVRGIEVGAAFPVDPASGEIRSVRR